MCIQTEGITRGTMIVEALHFMADEWLLTDFKVDFEVSTFHSSLPWSSKNRFFFICEVHAKYLQTGLLTFKKLLLLPP